MSNDMRITSPVEIQSDSKARVAYDLMTFIGDKFESGDKSNRDYWLTLYSQCYKAACGQSLKYVLNKNE
ncbi:hypothetical protein [Xanthomonas sp. SHU 166]|uniref:hypothetical protein n=1 Tax=Xanthomonas sp. SHU 166 TaxID=1591170 RepID=UPI000D087C08|nr:hypothetical protein [Xanthomonas sp. SHU 166]